MSLSITIAVAVLALLCAAINLLEMSRDAWRRTGFGLLLLVVFLIFLNVTTGFPRPAHGALSPHETVAILVLAVAMAIGIAIGMIVQYAWAQPARFDFLDFVRPLVISPLVLLPLIDFACGQPAEGDPDPAPRSARIPERLLLAARAEEREAEPRFLGRTDRVSDLR